jgi:hypothetical protein
MNVRRRLASVTSAIQCEKPENRRSRLRDEFIMHFVRTDQELRRHWDEFLALMCAALARLPEQPPPTFFPGAKPCDRQTSWWEATHQGNFCRWLCEHDAAFNEVGTRLRRRAQELFEAHPEARRLL